MEVAIVHDYLTQRGGAERVVAEMLRLWPEAPLYTTFFRPESTFPAFGDADVRTSAFDVVPVDRRLRAMAPLMPAAIRSLGTLDHDLVVSSSSGWSHGVRTGETTFHVVYCHNPPRWLYETGRYLESGLARLGTWPLRRALLRWDRAAASRPDLYVVNSRAVQSKVRRAYQLEAPVVHPPVDVDRFSPGPRGDRFLVVSRLLAYKRIDLVVEAATRNGWGLDVVGDGPELARLRASSGPTVTFHGRLADHEVTQLLTSCQSFVLPGSEDFGIAPVEANAAGKPVIAYADAGALETMVEDETAIFFREQTVPAIEAAMKRALDTDFDQSVLTANARRFSSERFRQRLQAEIEEALSSRPRRSFPRLRRSA